MDIDALSETCGQIRKPVAWARPGHIGYIGPDLGVEPHSPSVAMLSVGLDAPLVLYTADGPVRTGSSFAPARTTQRIVATEGWILALFVDPSGVPATAIADEMISAAGPFGLGHRRERELAELCRGPIVDPDYIYARAIDGPALAMDPRIERIAATIRTDPAGSFRADHIAANLGVSTTYFLRLFTQHCGTTFRGYQRWNRMVHTIRSTVVGHDLTRSALDAGFATPSHFSETFRDMIGLSATRMLRAGIRFDLGTSHAR
ncbi:helix-turn-helix transcriptional regulator [Nocardia beijingensis]|uniref:AraC family transcriptional regulator n=1 Tax=Nocardia beijingensis TaxID=95162 RepID=UPI001894F795|nr:AraC family transcriptional regulator [Nocardia beijingensis]MBF6468077.1 helix-turn-helix transcriptional regulator [Nocardia beijingensis]